MRLSLTRPPLNVLDRPLNRQIIRAGGEAAHDPSIAARVLMEKTGEVSAGVEGVARTLERDGASITVDGVAKFQSTRSARSATLSIQ